MSIHEGLVKGGFYAQGGSCGCGDSWKQIAGGVESALRDTFGSEIPNPDADRYVAVKDNSTAIKTMVSKLNDKEIIVTGGSSAKGLYETIKRIAGGVAADKNAVDADFIKNTLDVNNVLKAINIVIKFLESNEIRTDGNCKKILEDLRLLLESQQQKLESGLMKAQVSKEEILAHMPVEQAFKTLSDVLGNSSSSTHLAHALNNIIKPCMSLSAMSSNNAELRKLLTVVLNTKDIEESITNHAVELQANDVNFEALKKLFVLFQDSAISPERCLQMADVVAQSASESSGAVKGGGPARSKFAKMEANTKTLKKLILKVFIKEMGARLTLMTSHLSFGNQIGAQLESSQKLQSFLEQLKRIANYTDANNLMMVAGVFNNPGDKAIREAYIKSLQNVRETADQLAAMPQYSSIASNFREVSADFKAMIDFVNTYQEKLTQTDTYYKFTNEERKRVYDIVRGGVALQDSDVADLKDVSINTKSFIDVSEFIDELTYSITMTNVEQSFRAASNLEVETGSDYTKVMGKAVAMKIDAEIKSFNEKIDWLEAAKKAELVVGNAVNKKNSERMSEFITYYREQSRITKQFYELIEVLEYHLRDFTVNINKDPKSLSDMHTRLKNMTMNANWYDESVSTALDAHYGLEPTPDSTYVTLFKHGKDVYSSTAIINNLLNVITQIYQDSGNANSAITTKMLYTRIIDKLSIDSFYISVAVVDNAALANRMTEAPIGGNAHAAGVGAVDWSFAKRNLLNQGLIGPVNGLSIDNSHHLPIFVIKAMISKIFVTLNTFDMFNNSRARLMMTPSRMVTGGAGNVEVNDELIELYYRLPLVVELHRTIFKQPTGANVPEITFIPDLSSVYSELIKFIFLRGENTPLIEDEVKQLIGIVNDIYQKKKDLYKDNIVVGIILDYIDDINHRFGFVDKADYDLYTDTKSSYVSTLAQRRFQNPYDSNKVVPDMLLEGDDGKNFVSNANKYRQVSSRVDMGEMDDLNTPELFNNAFVGALDRFKLLVADQFKSTKVARGEAESFTRIVESLKKDFRMMKSNDDKVRLLTKLLQREAYTSWGDHIKYVMFHETVGLNMELLEQYNSVVDTFDTQLNLMKTPATAGAAVLPAEEVAVGTPIAKRLDDIRALVIKAAGASYSLGANILNHGSSGAGLNAVIVGPNVITYNIQGAAAGNHAQAITQAVGRLGTRAAADTANELVIGTVLIANHNNAPQANEYYKFSDGLKVRLDRLRLVLSAVANKNTQEYRDAVEAFNDPTFRATFDAVVDATAAAVPTMKAVYDLFRNQFTISLYNIETLINQFIFYMARGANNATLSDLLAIIMDMSNEELVTVDVVNNTPMVNCDKLSAEIKRLFEDTAGYISFFDRFDLFAAGELNKFTIRFAELETDLLNRLIRGISVSQGGRKVTNNDNQSLTQRLNDAIKTAWSALSTIAGNVTPHTLFTEIHRLVLAQIGTTSYGDIAVDQKQLEGVPSLSSFKEIYEYTRENNGVNAVRVANNSLVFTFNNLLAKLLHVSYDRKITKFPPTIVQGLSSAVLNNGGRDNHTIPDTYPSLLNYVDYLYTNHYNRSNAKLALNELSKCGIDLPDSAARDINTVRDDLAVLRYIESDEVALAFLYNMDRVMKYLHLIINPIAAAGGAGGIAIAAGGIDVANTVAAMRAIVALATLANEDDQLVSLLIALKVTVLVADTKYDSGMVVAVGNNPIVARAHDRSKACIYLMMFKRLFTREFTTWADHTLGLGTLATPALFKAQYDLIKPKVDMYITNVTGSRLNRLNKLHLNSSNVDIAASEIDRLIRIVGTGGVNLISTTAAINSVAGAGTVGAIAAINAATVSDGLESINGNNIGVNGVAGIGNGAAAGAIAAAVAAAAAYTAAVSVDVATTAGVNHPLALVNRFILPSDGSYLLYSLSETIKHITSLRADTPDQQTLKFQSDNMGVHTQDVQESMATSLPIIEKLLLNLQYKIKFMKQILKTTPIKQMKWIQGAAPNTTIMSSVVFGNTKRATQWTIDSSVDSATLITKFEMLLDSLQSGCMQVLSMINNTLSEIMVKPAFFEIRRGFLEAYQQMNKALPIMPVSHLSYLFGTARARYELWPDVSSTKAEYQYMHATQQLLTRYRQEPNLSNNQAIGHLLNVYNNTADEELSLKDYLSTVYANLKSIRYLGDLKTYGYLQSLSSVMIEQLYTPVVPHHTYQARESLTNVLMLTESSSTREQLTKLRLMINAPTNVQPAATPVNVAVRNIVELNISPFNLNVLQQELAGIYLYNYASAFDYDVCQLFGTQLGAIGEVDNSASTAAAAAIKVITDDAADVAGGHIGNPGVNNVTAIIARITILAGNHNAGGGHDIYDALFAAGVSQADANAIVNAIVVEINVAAVVAAALVIGNANNANNNHAVGDQINNVGDLLNVKRFFVDTSIEVIRSMLIFYNQDVDAANTRDQSRLFARYLVQPYTQVTQMGLRRYLAGVVYTTNSIRGLGRAKLLADVVFKQQFSGDAANEHNYLHGNLAPADQIIGLAGNRSMGNAHADVLRTFNHDKPLRDICWLANLQRTVVYKINRELLQHSKVRISSIQLADQSITDYQGAMYHSELATANALPATVNVPEGDRADHAAQPFARNFKSSAYPKL